MTGVEEIAAFASAYGGYIAAASAAVSVVGAVAQANATKNAANYNATIADQRAGALREQGNANEEAVRRHAGMVLGSEAAGAADSTGLSGTNADVFKQSATNAELDALNERYKGLTGALSAEDQAALDRQQGRNAMTAGYLNAGAAALSAGGSYLNASSRVQRSGYGLS